MNRDGILIHLLTSKTSHSSSREFCILKESCRRGGCYKHNDVIGGKGFPAWRKRDRGKELPSQDQSLLVLPRVGGGHVRVRLAGGSSWGRFCKGRTKRDFEFSDTGKETFPLVRIPGAPLVPMGNIDLGGQKDPSNPTLSHFHLAYKNFSHLPSLS